MDALSIFRNLTLEEIDDRLKQLDGEREALVILLRAKRRERTVRGNRSRKPVHQGAGK